MLPFALTALAYTSSLRGEFQFDDGPAVIGNPAIRDVGRFLRERFFQGYLSPSRPVTDLTFALDFHASGLDVLAYHVTNVLLHLVVMGLVLLFTRRTLRRLEVPSAEGLALFMTGLFGLHPIQTQAVSYISQRAEVLGSLFYLVALLLLLEAEERGPTPSGIASYLGALAALLLGLGSKPIIATLPIMYLLYGLYFPPQSSPNGPAVDLRRHAWMTRLGLAVPFFLASAAAASPLLAYFTRRMEARFLDAGLTVSGGQGHYFLTQLRVLLRYLALLVWPAGQNFDYDFPGSVSVLEPRTAFAAFGVAALLVIAIVLLWWSRAPEPMSLGRKSARLGSFGLVWFFVILAPTSSIFPLRDVIEEHRVYLASWGILVALVAVGALLFQRVLRFERPPWRQVTAAGCVWCALGIAQYERNKQWDTRVSLWRDVVSKSPMKPRAHAMLADALNRSGDDDGAVTEYRLAMDRADDDIFLRHQVPTNLAIALLNLRRVDEAVSVLRSALAAAPGHPDLLNNYARALMFKGDLSGAAHYARDVIDRLPRHVEAHLTLGDVLLRMGDPDGALREFSAAATLDPGSPEPLYSMAVLYEHRRLLPQACTSWKRLLATSQVSQRENRARSIARTRVEELGCSDP